MTRIPARRHSETVAIADSQTSSHTYAPAALSHQLHAVTLTFPATLTDKPYASASVSIHHTRNLHLLTRLVTITS